MSIKILDCTLRDGGYYNNWQFSKKFIQNYIDHISRTEVDYIEIGFIFFPQDKKKGLTALFQVLKNIGKKIWEYMHMIICLGH